MNVWLDDRRPMPGGFDVHTTNAHHAVMLLRVGLVDLISLDHDLGDEDVVGTGYTVAKAIEEMAEAGILRRRLSVYFHTQNPVGRERMVAAVTSASRHSERITVNP